VTEPAGERPSPGQLRSIVGLVVANSSLILAILIYMGWAYDTALYGRFHLTPLDLGFGPQEFALRSLNLFSPAIVLVVVALILLLSVRVWGDLAAAAARTGLTMITDAVRRLAPAPAASGAGDAVPRPDRDPAVALGPEVVSGDIVSSGDGDGAAAEASATGRRLAANTMTGAGLALTAAGLILYWAAYHVPVSTFLVLALLGAGPLLLTWPARARRAGRAPYALALVIAAVCALWAGSVYAEQQGDQAAQNLIGSLPTQRLVLIYSVQELGLHGPGVTVTPLTAAGPYKYEYQGLRLLLAQSGTYYLLPQGWSPRYDFTYIVDQNEGTDVILY